jgi:uncharacterized membrane protein YjjP (DUF1212 family)
MSISVLPEDPLALAAEAGRRVLEAGGETYRAEDIVVRLCRSWGFVDAECFATPTGLIASIGEDGSSRAVVRRIARRSVDLRRIARLAEETSRSERTGAGPAEFRRALDVLTREKVYPYGVLLLAAGLSASLFTLLFQGSLRDAAAAFFVGVCIKATASASVSRQFPDFITNIAGAAVAAALSAVAVDIGFAENLDNTIIGSIMLLVPGLATVNSIRDTIAGDLVAGVARLADAFMAAAALSLGAGFALSTASFLERILP